MPEFHSVPLSSIHFDRRTRQRKDLGDLEGLKDSIRQVGLINPLLVTKDGLLIAGERRFTAILQLGWSHVPVQYREDLETEQARERVEHAENFHRQDLTWQEQAIAIFRFHELSKEADPTWIIEQTVSYLGVGIREVKRYLRVAEALLAGDQMVLTAPTMATASGICERKDARRRDEEREHLADVIKAKPLTVSLFDAGEVIESDLPVHVPIQSDSPILNLDFIAWAQSYTGPKFNLIHCDFPYGIGAGGHDQGAAKSFGGYEDSADDYWNLISALRHYGQTFIAESAHMLFWFSPTWYEETFARLSEDLGDEPHWKGWSVNPAPLIWHRSDNSGIIPDPRRMPRQVYETAFLCTRGDRFLVRPKSNLFPSPSVKEFHMSEKPKPVLEYFFGMLVDDTTALLDPTCGSANSLIVAKRLGAKSVLGIEKSPEFHASALANWKGSFNGKSDG